MVYETIRFEVEDKVGVLTLNRPQMVNAINRQMTDELIDFWQHRNEDADVRVVVVRGAGERGFCSGLDLKDVQEMYADRQSRTPENTYNFQRRLSLMFRLMRSVPQPIIAAVHGAAIGGGLSMAYTSDIRLASHDTVFRAQFINLGVGGADMGSSYFLWRIVGWGKAAEMCLTGDKVKTDEALRIGLVNHLYDRKDLMPEAMAMARRMAKNSQMALQLTKSALNMALNGMPYEDTVRVEDRGQTLLGLTMSTGINTNVQK
ncbi:MAG: enoyl-CoA hydratase/isomerase family protein [Thermodesulfobacteriota bacterium]